jgi:predicted RNA-binding protein
MCESHAYLLRAEGEELVMENVVHLAYEGEELVITDLLGDTKHLKATVKEIKFMEHRIELEPRRYQ